MTGELRHDSNQERLVGMVNKLVKDYDEKISRLGEQVADLQERMEKELSSKNKQKYPTTAELQDSVKQLDALVKNYGNLAVQVAELNNKIEKNQTNISPFADMAKDSLLKGYIKQIEALRKNYGDLDNRVSELNSKLNSKIEKVQADISSVAERADDSSMQDSVKQLDALVKNYENLAAQVAELNNTIEKNRSDLENKLQKLSPKTETKETRPIGKLIFVCATLLFNILATSIIICCPGNLGKIDSLPWFGIVILIACSLLNMVGTSIWLYEYYTSEEYLLETGNIIFTIVAEGVLLVLNILVMWLIAFHPLAGITDASIALTVLLVCANFAMLMLRGLYFLDEYVYVDVALERSGLAMNICGVAFAAGTVVALIFTMVV